MKTLLSTFAVLTMVLMSTTVHAAAVRGGGGGGVPLLLLMDDQTPTSADSTAPDDLVTSTGDVSDLVDTSDSTNPDCVNATNAGGCLDENGDPDNGGGTRDFTTDETTDETTDSGNGGDNSDNETEQPAVGGGGGFIPLPPTLPAAGIDSVKLAAGTGFALFLISSVIFLNRRRFSKERIQIQ